MAKLLLVLLPVILLCLLVLHQRAVFYAIGLPIIFLWAFNVLVELRERKERYHGTGQTHQG